jgi:hypothetical protein
MLSIWCAIVLSSCGLDAHERRIQGNWARSQELSVGFSTYTEWQFQRGRFEIEGYPPLRQAGRYRIIERHADGVTLLLYAQSGDLPTDDQHLRISFRSDPDELIIGAEPIFRRALP